MGHQIPRFFDGVELPSGRPVLPHNEVIRQHLLIAEGQQVHGSCRG